MKNFDTKLFLLVLIVLLTAAISSCNIPEVNATTKSAQTDMELDSTNLVQFDITNVDDEQGLAYGNTYEIQGCGHITFNVVAHYSSLVYDSTENQYYINWTKFKKTLGSDTVTAINLEKHTLLSN